MAKNSKILITDDSAFMRSVLKNILEGEGYANIIEAANGNEALDLIAKEKPDLALMDIIMPELGGMEVIKKVGKSTTILVISAVGQESIVEEAKKYGAVGYVVKPFDNNQVKEEVNKALL